MYRNKQTNLLNTKKFDNIIKWQRFYLNLRMAIFTIEMDSNFKKILMKMKELCNIQIIQMLKDCLPTSYPRHREAEQPDNEAAG